MRAAFSTTLVRLAKEDTRVVLLTGDHGYALFDTFRKECPNQYFNAGIAEQNMVGMAAGLAKAGFLPFVYGLSAFVPVRVLEQIKLDIAHDNLPVVLLGDGAGFVYSHLGTSHQSTEDIAVTRVIPNLVVLSPADRFEQVLCMEWAYQSKRSVYLRMGKSDRGDVHSQTLQAKLGSIFPIIQGKTRGLSFLATGSMLRTAVELVSERFHDASVWSIPSIKPCNEDEIIRICQQSAVVVTLEEHSVYGGLGAMVAELSASYAPTRVLRIGVQDRFSECCGSYEYLLWEHGLDLASIAQRVARFIAGEK